MQTLIVPIHPTTPEQRLVDTVVSELRKGALMLYPTDTGMALGCTLANKHSIERIRRIRNLPEWKSMTFLCHSLANISEYAKVSNQAFRMIKKLIPGPYTFILPATREVPNFACDPKRKTVGIRVPNATIANAILETLGEPLISITAKDEHDNEFQTAEEAMEALGSQVDVIVTIQKFSWMDALQFEDASTVIDMTSDSIEILRHGAGIELVEEII